RPVPEHWFIARGRGFQHNDPLPLDGLPPLWVKAWR
ncbi:MAG: hypothetical protein QOF20_924, partial [Acidimicrobiaceae bacterium]|nr:hypothetical protein [Acidimicrobiaceae bacterium]